jgi:hypothetical protein
MMACVHTSVLSTIRKQQSRSRVDWIRSSDMHCVSRRFLLSDSLQSTNMWRGLLLSIGLVCSNCMPRRQLLPVLSVANRMPRGPLECSRCDCLHVLPSGHLRCAQQPNICGRRLPRLSTWLLLHWWIVQGELQFRSLRNARRSIVRRRCLRNVFPWILLPARHSDCKSALRCGQLLSDDERPYKLSFRPMEFSHWAHCGHQLHCLWLRQIRHCIRYDE